MTAPTVSVIFESANLDRAGFDRLEESVRTLDGHLGAAVEVLFMDDEITDPARLDALVNRSLPRSRASGVDVRRIGAPGANYYLLKAIGAEQARGEVLVFLDSDVIYPTDVVGRLAEAVLPEDVGAACAATSVGPLVDFWSRSTYLWWNFTLIEDTPRIVDVGNYFANSFAMRAEVLRQVPMSSEVHSHRHECVFHSARLREAGYRVTRDTGLVSWHEPPSHLLRRTLEHGGDRHLRRFVEGRDAHPLLVTVAWQYLADVRRIGRRLRQGRRSAGLPWWQVPACVVAGMAYFALVAIGHLAAGLTRRRPTG